MKKLLIMFLVAVLAITSAGCGLRRKLEEKVGNAIGEKMLESVTGGNVDIEGDEVTIKGEDGSELTFGSTEWPKTDLSKHVPEFKKGTITSVAKSDEIIMISIEGVKKEDFEDYWDKIKDDFTKDAIHMEMDDMIQNGGSNDKGVYVQLIYSPSSEALNINISKSNS